MRAKSALRARAAVSKAPDASRRAVGKRYAFAKKSFGTSPLEDIDSRTLHQGISNLERGLQRANGEAESIFIYAKKSKGKYLLMQRHGEVCSHIRELEDELRCFYSERSRRKQIKTTVIDAKLQKERERLKAAPTLPTGFAQQDELICTTRGDTMVKPQVSKTIPDFVEKSLPILAPGRNQHWSDAKQLGI